MKKNLYLAARLKNLTEPFFLTSEAMHLEGETWIFDLSPVISFWNYHCTASRSSLSSLLTSLLQNIDVDFVAVLSTHPWMSLLQLHALQERNFRGFFNLLDLFNAKRYESITFSCWLSVVESFSTHLKSKDLQKNLPLLQRSVARLSLQKIGELKEASFSELKRRYSHTLATVMGWTFTEKQQHTLDPFPWKNFTPPVVPEIKRHLDYCITCWGEVSFLLCEDLDKLTDTVQESVLQLTWHLTLQPLQEKIFTISFRNPHILQSERKTHDTCLRQFEAAFQALSKELATTEELLMLLSWKISATRTMSRSFIERSVFGNIPGLDLLKLENKLNAPLNHFALLPDFTPEHSYREGSTKDKIDIKEQKFLRPLFIFETPQPLSEPPKQRLFTERVTTHWWDQEYQVRDYFLALHENPRWVFWDHISQKWFEHGHFG